MDAIFKSLTRGMKLPKDISARKSENNHIKVATEEKNSLPKPLNTPTTYSVEEVDALRKANKIRVFGSDYPSPLVSFSQLFTGKYSIPSFLQTLLSDARYSSPTPIQMQSIPILLANRDLMACAPTGSGKTLAFMIPIISLLQRHEKAGFRALIVLPSHELANQIEREFFKIAGQFKICLLANDKLAGLKSTSSHTFDILIATPLTLINAVKSKIIHLSNLKILILDEADRLLEEKFLEQTDDILAACPDTVLKGLFTATLNSSVEALANTFMRDPLRVYVGSHNSAANAISQKLLFVGSEEGKIMAVRQLIRQGIQPPILIFMDSIDRANNLYIDLMQEGILTEVIHSDKSTAERSIIITNFRIGKIWVLITTELLARGIDFKGVQCVINYDVPRSSASYIHRIGRTGRAGKQGNSITLYTLEDTDYLRSIANVMLSSGCTVPEHLLQLKKMKNSDKRKRPLKDKSSYPKSKSKRKIS